MSSKRGIVLYLHVHQPWRVREYTVFDTAVNHDYFGECKEPHRNNRAIFEKVADKSYRPMTQLLKQLLDTHPDFKVSLSISGTMLEQAEAWAPDVMHSAHSLILGEPKSSPTHITTALRFSLAEQSLSDKSHYTVRRFAICSVSKRKFSAIPNSATTIISLNGRMTTVSKAF